MAAGCGAIAAVGVVVVATASGTAGSRVAIILTGVAPGNALAGMYCPLASRSGTRVPFGME